MSGSCRPLPIAFIPNKLETLKLIIVRTDVMKLAVIAAKIFPKTISTLPAGAERSISIVRRSFSHAVISMAGYIAPMSMNMTNM